MASTLILRTAFPALALVTFVELASANEDVPVKPEGALLPASEVPVESAGTPIRTDGAPQEEAKRAPEAPLDVSVVGTRVQQTSGSAHVITPKQLGRFKNDDPHKILGAVPGVYVRGEDGFGLRPNIGIRGAMSDRSKKITLMEDGVLFGPAPYSAPAAYFFPLMMRMQSVRVVKGPSAITYGPHTIGGAIDLVTAPIPSERRGFVDVAVGQFMHRKVHLQQGLADDHYGILIEAAHLANDGFKQLDGGGDTGFARNEIMLKGRYVLGPVAAPLSEFEVKLGYSGEISNETYLGLTDRDFRATPYRRYAASQFDRMEWHRTQVQLTHRAKLSRNVDVVSTAYRHDLHRAWRKVNGFRGASIVDVLANPDDPKNAVFHGVLTGAIGASSDAETLFIGPNDRRFVSQGIQSTLTVRAKTGPIKHRVEYGFRIHYDSIERHHTQDSFSLQGAEVIAENDPTETTADNSARTIALSMYAIDAMTWGPLTVTAGARLESIRSEMDNRLTDVQDLTIQQVIVPGAGVYLALPREFGLLAGVHQGFSPVPPGQDGLVRPEKSINYEAGIRYSPRRFRAEVIGFYNDYRNITNICSFSTGCVIDNLDQQFDGGSARVLGIEAYAESELEVRKGVSVPGRLSYTFTDARFLTDFQSADPIFDDVKAGDQVPYVPTHQLVASIGVEMAKWGVNLSGTYMGRMREVAGQGEIANGDATDDFFLLDASANLRISKWLTLYTTGRNLLDATYITSRRPYGARPGAPRWLQLGAKAEF
jgi:Fe(3+) dicitrate transport protein